MVNRHFTFDAERVPADGLPRALPLECDISRKYVRVTEVRADGLVVFDFSIGWPELSVELMLPHVAFDEFCMTNRVIRLDAQAGPDNSEETDA